MDSQSHYFDEDPTVPSENFTVDLVLPDLTATLRTSSGIFSSKKIDPGTKYLLQHAPATRCKREDRFGSRVRVWPNC
ncbi:MAG: hypothetical protein ACJ0F6_02075 [Acidimicrobiales bacterium]